MIEYWHWHTLHYGAETYWGGVLPHNGRPGRTYREVARLGAELAKAGELVAGITPDADVTLLYSMPSKWLMQKYPALTTKDGAPDERAYHGFFDPLYRGAFDAGLQARVVHAGQLLGADSHHPRTSPEEAARRHPVLVVPAFYVAGDPELRWLREYAAAGGHLVLGPRTGYGDHEARARTETAPAFLSDAAGLWYDEFSNVAAEVRIQAGPDSPLTLEPDAAGTRWIDGVINEHATVLATYLHPHFGQWPAVTTHRHGAGRVTYLGTIPNQSLARSIFRWLVPEPASGWRALPQSVTATSATAEDGTRVHFVHNWSWEDVPLTVTGRFRDVLSDEVLASEQPLRLGAWDVRILTELTD
jgi:beta-galactosidase